MQGGREKFFAKRRMYNVIPAHLCWCGCHVALAGEWLAALTLKHCRGPKPAKVTLRISHGLYLRW